jgi:hypothetical protein
MTKRPIAEEEGHPAKHSKGTEELLLSQFPADILRRIFEYVIPDSHRGEQKACSVMFRMAHGPFDYPSRYATEYACAHFIIEFLRLRHTCRRFMHLLAARLPKLEHAGQDGKWAPPGCGPIVWLEPFDDHHYPKGWAAIQNHVMLGPVKLAHPHPLVNHLTNFWNRARLRQIIFGALEKSADRQNSETPILAQMFAAIPWRAQLPIRHLLDPSGGYSPAAKLIAVFYACRTWRRAHNDEGFYEGHLRIQVEERLRARGYLGENS